jgi:hypothetical protein
MRAKTVKTLGFLACLVLLVSAQAAGSSPGEQQISTVTLTAPAFNPGRGEQVRLTYTLAQPDAVTMHVYDPDGGLVRTLLHTEARTAGAHEAVWDGRDEAGRLVPNEAYTFTIETASGALYDPTTFSGGVVGDITKARFASDGTVVYKLPAPARVLIRLGLHSGPMLKTLVDWKPRVAGTITEYWDGRDEDDMIQLREHKHFTALITYVTLPKATVITYGNDQETYREYKLGRAKDRPQKPERPRRPDPTVQLRPEGLVPPAWTRSPRVRMTFPQHAEGTQRTVPTVREAVEVRVDVDPADRDLLLHDQFEIIFFVDNVFFAEAERGYLPFHWRWELLQIPAGEHILTVNISSFTGHVGMASRKVRVIKDKP